LEYRYHVKKHEKCQQTNIAYYLNEAIDVY